jgi:hypothetical protein
VTIAQPRPLCYLWMPSGASGVAPEHAAGVDAVDRMILRPAIEDAGLECVRADEDHGGHTTSEPSHQRMLLCDVALVDLTNADAETFHELGVRDAVRPFTTVIVVADANRSRFDLPSGHRVAYHVGEHGHPSSPDEDRRRVAEQLRTTSRLTRPLPGSPVAALLDDVDRHDIHRLKTDVFRDTVAYPVARKEELRRARGLGPAAVRAVLDELGDLRHVDVGVVVDVLLSFRAVDAHTEMVDLVERGMDATMQRVTLVREQYAFALNRIGRGDDAERVLLDLLDERGPSSETYGLLGRVYKDRWAAADHEGRPDVARGLLRQAADAYTKGFEADWRDAYPGINAVELMTFQDPPDPRRDDLLPVVRYAATRRLSGTPDYWDHATVLELAILQLDEPGARRALAQALAALREPWEATSTLTTLQRLRATAELRRTGRPWMDDIERQLAEAATPPG